jgi:hypothetical protein
LRQLSGRISTSKEGTLRRPFSCPEIVAARVERGGSNRQDRYAWISPMKFAQVLGAVGCDFCQFVLIESERSMNHALAPAGSV